MNMSSCLVAFAALTAALSLLLRDAVAQIPTVCADEQSLANSVCCPSTADGECGGDANRGSCVDLNTTAFGYNASTTNVRVNWPHYYTRVCACNGNYAGYDCSRCRFGYYGPGCSNKRVLPRRPVRDFTDEDWATFNGILRLTRTYDSGYSVVLEEATPGTTNLTTTNVSLYHLYIWIHHYTAKDSQNPNPGTYLQTEREDLLP